MVNLLMLWHEAIRLASRQEQRHGRITSDLAVAATHDRRHADAQAVGESADHYLRWVQGFTAYLGRSPDTATVEEMPRCVALLLRFTARAALGVEQVTVAASLQIPKNVG
jgi:hypothetical protein